MPLSSASDPTFHLNQPEGQIIVVDDLSGLTLRLAEQRVSGHSIQEPSRCTRRLQSPLSQARALPFLGAH
jgi:hypothetical protein